jgi:hypothetical protein
VPSEPDSVPPDDSCSSPLSFFCEVEVGTDTAGGWSKDSHFKDPQIRALQRIMAKKIAKTTVRSVQIVRRLLTLLLCVAAFSNATRLDAQSRSSAEEGGRNALRSLTSALTALSSDDGVSSGVYKFENDGEEDTELKLNKFVGELPLGEHDLKFLPILEVSPALLKLTQNFEAGDAEIDTWSLGVGVGLRMKFFDDLVEITPRIAAEYAEVDLDFGIEGFENLTFDVDTWSYIPSLELIFRPGAKGEIAERTQGGWEFGARVAYLYVQARTSEKITDDFSDDSWIWKNRISYELEANFVEQLGPLYFRPSIGRVDVAGSARKGLGLDNFYEVGLEIVTRQVAPKYLKEIGLGAAYIYEDEVYGWRFGVVGKLA